MSGYILCHEKKAVRPYYIEAVGIRIWTIEELCYYVSSYVWLLDSGFFCEELCDWVDRQLLMPRLAKLLYAEYYRGKSLRNFIEILLTNTGYCNRAEIEQLTRFLDGMEHVSEMERLKQKGDYFLGDRKYRRAIGMYNQILGMRKNQELTGDFYGNVWNNKGLAYAALYLFDEAFSCMKKAHEELRSEASGQALLGALYLMVPREEFTKRAAFEGFSEGEIFSFLGEAEAIVPEKKSLPVVELKREYDRENS